MSGHSNAKKINYNFSYNKADIKTCYNEAEIAGGAIVTETNHNIKKISECTFVGNSAQIGGVIFSADNTRVKHKNIVLKYNNASRGIMYFTNSCAIFTGNNVIIKNTGSVTIYHGRASFKGTTTIMDNLQSQFYNLTLISTISPEGGGITVLQSIVNFDGIVSLKQNTAINGGAILSVSSKLNILGNISVIQNYATDSGGGIYLYQGEIVCEDRSTLKLFENRAADKGGGIHAIESTITSHYSFYSDPSLAYSGSRLILVYNTATNFGGGISFENNAKLKVFMKLSPLAT